jgi:hypothetical protein
MIEERERNRIHFLTDVKEGDGDLKCQRCGETREDKWGMYAHRDGLLSECLRNRIKQWVSRLA